MSQRWVGNSGRILQVIFVVCAIVPLAIVIVFAWYQFNNTWMKLPWLGFYLFCFLGLCVLGLTVWAVTRFRQVVVVVDDRGLTISRGGRDQFIGWGDVAYYAYVPAGGFGHGAYGPSVQIQPRPRFFRQMGGGTETVRQSLAWTLSGMSFSGKQLSEILLAMKDPVEHAGGRVFALPPGQWRVPDDQVADLMSE